MEKETAVTYFLGFNGFIPVYITHYLTSDASAYEKRVMGMEAKGHRIFSYCRKPFKQKDRDEKV